MRVHVLVSTFLGLSLICVVGVAGDVEEDVARLDELQTNIKAILPSGWAVNIELSDEKIPNRRGSYPTLAIKSNEPLPVEHFYPGMPGRSVDEPEAAPKITREFVALYFVALPRMSPQEYATRRESNDALRDRRSKFEFDHLKKIARAHKGDGPIPPDAFEARTEDEVRLIRQYAFLWISTRPQPLPTNYTDHFSFVMHLPGSMRIHNAEKSTEYGRLLEAVQKIIVPYEKEP